MSDSTDLQAIHTKIQGIKKAVEELKQLGNKFPSVSRNADRILASIKMLEFNISDCVDLDLPE